MTGLFSSSFAPTKRVSDAPCIILGRESHLQADFHLRLANRSFRVRDWLYGVHNHEPSRTGFIEPQSEAERLRVLNNLITLPSDQGGAGITPNHGEWENVTAIFPLHDEETNKKWIRDWSQKTFLSPEDLDQIRDKFGESVSSSRFDS